MGNIVHLYYGPPAAYPNWYHRYMMISSAGVEISRDAYYSGNFSWNQDPHCVDSDGNIYIAGKWAKKIYKLGSDGAKLAEIDYDTATQCAITIDGDLWFYEWDDDGNSALRKRDKDTLEILDEFSISGNDYTGMAFDADDNVYLIDYSQKRIEKFNVGTKSFVSRRDLPAELDDNAIYCSLAVLDDVVYLANWNAYGNDGPGYIWSCSTALDADFVTNAITEFDTTRDAIDVITAFEGTHIVIVGEKYGSGKKTIAKYDSSFTLVWETDVVYTGSELGVAAFPFPVTAAVYDYPLLPIMFPAHTRGSTLKQKCRHFEESMSDICLTLNHNVNVTREYLRLTYGDTTYLESSNLRDVLPSQQLIELSGKDPDFNAIINNFIKNISDMFLLINENNTLVKTWLNDYEPDEIDHEFTDVRMKPIIIGDDLDKAMDELFDGIEDNVTVLNTNLELLIERF